MLNDSNIEHAKHLRSIQFSLVFFCTVVLVTVFSQEKSIKEQSILFDIDAILTFLKKYPDGRQWLLENIALNSQFDPITVGFTRPNPNSNINVRLKSFVLDNVKLNSGILGKSWGIIEDDDEILTLHQFKQFWEFIEKGNIYFFNNGNDYEYLKSNITQAELYQTPINDLEKVSNHLKYTFKENIRLIIKGERSYTSNRDRSNISKSLEEYSNNPIIKLLYFDEEELTYNIQVLIDINTKENNVKSVIIKNISILPNPTKMGNLFISEHFFYKKKWRPFERSFPYLSKLDKYYDTIPINELKLEYQDELKHNDRKIEFLGLKIPEQILSQWSPFIIMLITIYYILHFIKFHQLSTNDQENIHFPWIGLYSDIFSQLTHIATLIILPSITIYCVSGSWWWIAAYFVEAMILLLLTFKLHRIAFYSTNKKS